MTRGDKRRTAQAAADAIKAEDAFCQHVGGEIIKGMAMIRAAEMDLAQAETHKDFTFSLIVKTAIGDWLIAVARPLPEPEEPTT